MKPHITKKGGIWNVSGGGVTCSSVRLWCAWQGWLEDPDKDDA